MPKLEADFGKISHEYQAIPDADYRVTIDEIKETETRENKLPQLEFHLKVAEGEYEGRKLTDFVILKQNDGKVNEIGLGRVKAYAIAVLGEEAANGSAIDTDELRGGSCIVVVKSRTYEKKDKSQGTSQDIKKVLPVS